MANEETGNGRISEAKNARKFRNLTGVTNVTSDSNHHKLDTNSHNENTNIIDKGTRKGIPRVVWLIIMVEFCERFAYYGMFTLLTRYLASLGLDDHSATSMYHLFVVINYAASIPGAMIADSWWGRFKTIAIMSTAYAAGFAILSASAICSSYVLSLVALMIIASGSGGIKPCVSTFGADQIENQKCDLITRYFAYFYLSINVGSMISMFATPVIRSQSCLNMVTCYPAAFGIPAVGMWLSVVLFMLGSSFYKKLPPSGNIIVKAIKASWLALRQPKRNVKEHWLYRADTVYDRKFLADVLRIFEILLVLSPIPLFWGLYEQQGSRWLLQSLKTNNEVFGYHLIEEQILIVNPIVIAIFIPTFTRIIYPLTTKCGFIVKAHQRMAAGGMLAAIAFVISGILEIIIQKNAGLYSTEARSAILNLTPYDIQFNDSIIIPALGSHSEVIWTSTPVEIEYSAAFINHKATKHGGLKISFLATPGFVTLGTIFTFENDTHVDVRQHEFKPGPKTSQVIPIVLTNSTSANYTVRFESLGRSHLHHMDNVNSTILLTNESFLMQTSTYDVFIDGSQAKNPVKCEQITSKIHRFYVYAFLPALNKCHLNVIVKPHISILWQLIQIVAIATAEIMVSVTGLEFAYSQAPDSMKAIVSSFWTLTVSLGNVAVVIIESLRLFRDEALSYFCYALMMAAVIGIFLILCRSFKYKEEKMSECSMTTLYSASTPVL